MKKTLSLANGVALLITIVINYLANTGIFGDNTMASISAEFPTYFTPARYAFSIWILIYLGLLAFAFHQARALSGNPEATDLVDRIGGWFLLSCLANCCWVLAFCYGYIGLSVLIMLVLCLSLAMIVLRTDMELTDPPLRTIAFVWWPFSLYAGWISLAFFADLSVWLRKIEWTGWGIHAAIWAIIFIIIAGALHLYLTWRRNMREFALVGVWGLLAIGITDLYQGPTVSVVAFAMAAILFVSSNIHGFRNRATSPFRHRVR